MKIGFTSKSSTKRFEAYAARAKKRDYLSALDALGKKGVRALEKATPEDTGVTQGSWSYKIKNSSDGVTLSWHNDHKTDDGDPIIIMLAMGHGTGTGGWVEGRNFINPAAKPVMEEIAKQVRKAVKP